MTLGTADVEVAGVHKAFGGQPVLSGVDLLVPSGSFVAILGPSGGGKTTLLRILAGFERPDRGTVRLGGSVVDDGACHVAPERRQIGYVSQEGSLFPHLSVEANVGFGLARRERRIGRVDHLLEAVGLEGLGRRFPHELSGGQQQRVALARALAVQPRLVLLDEPFAALDAGLRASVRADVQAILTKAGATTILVTHDQDEALSMADSVAVLRSGTIVQQVSPAELYASPVDPDLARFVGAANLVDGVLEGPLVRTELGAFPARLLGPSPVAPSGPPAVLAVVAMIRPEQVHLRAPAPEAPLQGVVARASYHGHDTDLAVTLVGLGEGHRADRMLTVRMVGNPPALGSRVGIEVKGPLAVWAKRPPALPSRGEGNK